jgi:predicted ATP-dependent endonuclease of OLD family
MIYNMSLKLKNFKRIRNEVLFTNFGKYNFFVGKNNSGKSSILNALTLINDGTNSKRFFSKDSIAELSYNNIKGVFN